MKVLVIGHKGSGKSTVGRMLAGALNVSAMDSSNYCFEKAVWPVLEERYGYPTKGAALADKDNRRDDWFNLIAAYNDVPDRVTREILADHDFYIGMRNRREFEGSKHHFDLIIWVDASARVEDEPSTSMELTIQDAHTVLDNNGTKKDLIQEVQRHVFLSLDMIDKIDCGNA